MDELFTLQVCVSVAGTWVCDVTVSNKCALGEAPWLLCRSPGTFQISHPKVRAALGGVRSILAARAGAQLQACLLPGGAGDGSTRRCPKHAEGTCWGQLRSLPSNSAAPCLELGCQGHRAIQAGVGGPGEAILFPRGLLSKSPWRDGKWTCTGSCGAAFELTTL